MGGGEMKNLWIIANWKSNKTIKEALEWISYVGPKIEKRENLKVVVCPPFTDVPEVKKAVTVGNFPLMVGVQDLSPFDSGAYTGEEAANIMRDFIELAILGHSERRQNFGETDEMVAMKVIQAVEHDIIPLVCVQDENTKIPDQVRLVAYEPTFAIGTGNPDTPENADQVAKSFKDKLKEVEVLYGGSVTSENVKAFLNKDNINGVLIGTASLDPEEFVEIIDSCLLI